MTPTDLTAIVAGVTMLGGVGGWFLKAKTNGGHPKESVADVMRSQLTAFRSEMIAEVRREGELNRSNLTNAILVAQAKIEQAIAERKR